MNHNPDPIPPAERDRLEQELLELHFGCHPDPEALLARLAAEPALRALQQEVLRRAEVLKAVATPVAASLDLAAPTGANTTRRWWHNPWRRLSGVAAAAALVVGVTGALWGYRVLRRDGVQREQCHVTVAAPRAIPAGAPWSFTVDCLDAGGAPHDGKLNWRVVAQDGSELASGERAVRGREVIAMSAGLLPPRRVEVTATHAKGQVAHALDFDAHATAPLVHLSTDRPVYQPGEPVFVRTVVLDRVTLQPTSLAGMVQLRVLDPKGAAVQQTRFPLAAAPGALPSVGGSLWTVPADAAGGEFVLEVTSPESVFPPERLPIVVRRYEAPRLQKELLLARKTHGPGERGSAALSVRRLGGDAAAGAAVRAALVLDGVEVWSQDATLDAEGRTSFRFEVPKQVKQGAARLVVQITDGGVVETEVEPFVVPTGEIRLAAFPEGGELIAGVENRVYFEAQDPLGRPVECVGVLVDQDDRKVTTFASQHQGRGVVAFTPTAGMAYRVRAEGLTAPLALPSVRERGIALRTLGDQVDAGAPVRVAIAGRGDGPWVVGVFARGVLLGQAAVRPDEDGTVAQEIEIAVPAVAAGVLRVTVFDRQLRPVAERLVRRLAEQRLAIELTPERATLAPGEAQTVAVRTRNERGEPVPAVVGLTVSDVAALELGDEPRVGLLDQVLLFADVERLEDLGDWFFAHERSARHVDLLLGTRGWRRFVWQGDDASKQRIAAAGTGAANEWAKGQHLREGFMQVPQVASNRAAVDAMVGMAADDVWRGRRTFEQVLAIALLVLLAFLLGEGLVAVVTRQRRPRLKLVGCGVPAALATVVAFWWQAQARPVALGLVEDFRMAPAAVPMALRDRGQPADPLAQAEGLDLFGAPVLDAADHVELQDFVEDLAKMPVADDAKRPAAVAVLPRAAGPASPGPNGPLGRTRPDAHRVLTAIQYAHRHVAAEQRADRTATVCWQPLLVTDGNGAASTTFDTSDAVTTWRVHADAHGAGRVGQAETTFAAQLPFHVECKLPIEVAAGDLLQIPIAITLTHGDAVAATVDVTVRGPAVLQGDPRVEVALVAGRGRHLAELRVQDTTGTATIIVRATCGRLRDVLERTLVVAPRGFPQVRSFAGMLTAAAPATLRVNLPSAALPGSGKLTLRVFPSPLAGLAQGLQGILREPCGCFEQASSSNYPNVMALALMQATGDDVPAIAARAHELLPKGYARITGYECKERGYEWFGGDPGHEALSAYGLLQFHDMAKVHPVDAAMVERTRQWLLARRDGSGGYRRNDRALDSFGRAPQLVTDAYVTYALLYAGAPRAELGREIERLAQRATATTDAYELALAALGLWAAGDARAGAARNRLLGMQQPDGSLRGNTTSITSSGGNDLAVETTSLAILAWLEAGKDDAALRGAAGQAVRWLQAQRSASGTYGATQATVGALRALTAYAERNRGMQAAGTIAVFAGTKKLQERAFAAGQAEPVTFELWDALPPGEHELRLELGSDGDAELPWACDLRYHGELPADDPDGKVSIATRLLIDRVDEGKTAAIDVMVANRTDDGQPMTLAVIGLPAGLDVPISVLDDRRKAGAFDLWELRGRELALYWRSLAPNAEHRVLLDTVAAVPGTTSGPSSRAYLYYTPAAVRWASPLRVTVSAAK